MKKYILIFLILISLPCYSDEREIEISDIKNMWLNKEFSLLEEYSGKLLALNKNDIIGNLISMDLIILTNKDLKEIKKHRDILLEVFNKIDDERKRVLLKNYRAHIKLLFAVEKEEHQKSIRKVWYRGLSSIVPSYPLTLKIFDEKDQKITNKVDLSSLWKSRKDDELLRIAKESSSIDNIVSLLVNFDFMISKGITIEKLLSEFNKIRNILDINYVLLYNCRNEGNEFLSYYRSMIINIKLNKISIDKIVNEVNDREKVPRAISLAENFLNRKLKEKEYKEKN
ncbi:MAG: hypothetical protein KAI43_04535 [Candidatus Aureabacteria bacterium]|nr:hypothetical protein [Candidatus Auribacterota bacterium]